MSGTQYIECSKCNVLYLRGSGLAFCPHRTEGEDPVRHPSHYTFGKFEVIDVLEDWFSSDPLLWQVGKYIARSSRKSNQLEDLRKAEWYLKRRIGQLERDSQLAVKPQTEEEHYERKDLGQFTGIVTDGERVRKLNEKRGFVGSADKQSDDRYSATSKR